MGTVALWALWGAWRGFFRGLFGMLALGAGVAAVAVLGAAAGAWVEGRWPGLGGASGVVVRGVLFLVPFVALQAVGVLLHRLGRMVFLGGIDRVAGAVLGACTAAVVVGAVVAAAVASWPGAAGWLAGSKLAVPLAERFRGVAEWAAQWMPWP